MTLLLPKLLLGLLQALSIFFVLFHLYSRSRTFRPLTPDWMRPRAKLGLYLYSSGIAILGTYLGARLIGGGIANTRAVGAVLGGLLGGPILGTLVGATAGAHRMTLGGFSAFAGAVSTTLEGLAAGLIHLYVVRRRAPERLVDWKLAAAVTAIGETVHMGIVLLLARPFADAVELVRMIGPPMILANSAGAALFMTILRDRFAVWDQVGALSSAKALKIAERTLGLVHRGFNRDVATGMASIIQEQTGVGAVAITDSERVLAFVGVGSDHHRADVAIQSSFTRKAIATKEVIFADGVREHYICPLSPSCNLDSVLVVPLEVDGAVIGTVQLFEPREKRFRSMNKSLGEGIAAVLSNQLLASRYQEQKNLLVMAELKLVQAQVNPHFLFNSLNTISAVTRIDPDRARELLVHLSTFFRKNLKRSSDLSTLAEELEHVGSYLEIEKARFGERLVVETDVDPTLLGLRLPTFTLQPLIENAIKHGLSATLANGVARIRAQRRDGHAVIDIEDNAGTWGGSSGGTGLGMQIVDKRIKNLLGDAFGVTVSCVPHELTRVSVRVPLAERPS
jgi:two-component system LytT family sensor kinase